MNVSNAAKKIAPKPCAADSELKVLFVATEAFPFAGTGGLGEVIGSLPKALTHRLVDARVILPLYGAIADKYRAAMRFVTKMQVHLGWRSLYCGVYELLHDGVITYFVDNEYYFKRDGIYGHYDDAERFAFFNRAVLDVLPALGFTPNIIHVHDHAAALLPVYFKSEYLRQHGYEKIKTVLTIHNLEYQGCYPPHILGDVLGLDESRRGIVDYNGMINFLKGGIEAADVVTTVSPTYADEILMPDRACGLYPILQSNKDKLIGILNGINYDDYNPETGGDIACNYSVKTMATGKAQCRAALCSELGWQSDRPILAVISRLATHKGLDLIKSLVEHGELDHVRLVVLGTGEKYLQDFFTDVANRAPDRVKAFICFDKGLAKRIYSGADMFVMPSASEPCGLSQMIAAHYGTIPIVRTTGGLKDSIIDWRDSEKGNGFRFDAYSDSALRGAILAAITAYNSDDWKKIMINAMTSDFSWNNSAGKYVMMYNNLLKKPYSN